MTRRPFWLVGAAALALSSCTGVQRPVGPQAAVVVADTVPETTTTAEALAIPTTEAPTTTAVPAPTTTVTPPSLPPPPSVTTPPTVAAKSASSAPRAVVRAPNTATVRSVVGDIPPYNGLGTWVDVYDWSHYKNTTPTVGPDQVDEMAAQGVQTLFIQTAKHDTPDLISEPELLVPIITRAHERGLRVVAWYLPTMEDNTNDLNRLVASANLDVDGLAVDVESRKVPDPAERSARLVDLSKRLREALPGRALGAIVMPPVQLEVVNPNYWPGFPWAEIAPLYDVWQTMGYWTDRKESSGYRDPYRYTDENIKRLRANLGNPSAAVSPVGGVGAMGPDDVEAFGRAAADNGAIGGSIYDFRTTRPEAWPSLRKFRSA